MKILAVDDDSEFLQIFESTLSNLGYSNITTAESADEALKKITAAEFAFDCFILDVQMPGMDGIQLCETIRNMPEYDRTPIVMNTAMSDKAHIDRAFVAGATDYLTKPINEVEIGTRLGVLHSLVRERIRSQHAIEHEGVDILAPSYRFTDLIPMRRDTGSTEYTTLENYLKTLGVFRAYSTKVIGLHVENGLQIFEEAGASIFGEVMVDLATCISDCLKIKNPMISYAGKGDFICLFSRVEVVDSVKIHTELRKCIAQFAFVYDELNVRLPQICVGSAIACKSRHIKSPLKLLEEAVLEARFAATLRHARVELCI